MNCVYKVLHSKIFVVNIDAADFLFLVLGILVKSRHAIIGLPKICA